jgi:hypothetical protein
MHTRTCRRSKGHNWPVGAFLEKQLAHSLCTTPHSYGYARLVIRALTVVPTKLLIHFTRLGNLARVGLSKMPNDGNGQRFKCRSSTSREMELALCVKQIRVAGPEPSINELLPVNTNESRHGIGSDFLARCENALCADQTAELTLF